jgi:hypothetical protein
MKRCFDGTDQENSKTQGEKGPDQESSKKQEGKNGGKKKKRFLLYVEVPILKCSSSFGNALRLPPLCNPPSGEPTCMRISPTQKQQLK